MTSRVLRLRADRLPWREIEGEVVALDVASSRYLGANCTGAMLWARLADGCTEEALVQALTPLHPDGVTAARQDVTAFLADLRERDLLEA